MRVVVERPDLPVSGVCGVVKKRVRASERGIASLPEKWLYIFYPGSCFLPNYLPLLRILL